VGATRVGKLTAEHALLDTGLGPTLQGLAGMKRNRQLPRGCLAAANLAWQKRDYCLIVVRHG
jgi:hypothetical protein